MDKRVRGHEKARKNHHTVDVFHRLRIAQLQAAVLSQMRTTVRQERREKMSEPIKQKVFIECETAGFEEATQVTIKNCRDCTINVYPSQTKIIDFRGEEKEDNDN